MEVIHLWVSAGISTTTFAVCIRSREGKCHQEQGQAKLLTAANKGGQRNLCYIAVNQPFSNKGD